MKKIILLTLFLAFCSTLSGYLFHIFFQNPCKSQNSLNKAFHYLSIGKLNLSTNIVNNHSLCPIGRKFLSAVFLQQNQKFEKSNAILKTILEDYKINRNAKKPHFLEEALALKILNYFLLNQQEEVSQDVKQFRHLFPNSQLLPLIESFTIYDDLAASEAIQKISFCLYAYKQNNLNNSWFFYNLKQLIPTRTLLLKKAQNLIYLQKFDRARSIINKELEQLFQNTSQWVSEDYQTIIILYALSYFHELKKHSENLLNYYESISFYLEKLDSTCSKLYKQYFLDDDLFFSCLNSVETSSENQLPILAKILFYHQKYSNMSPSQFMENYFLIIKEAKYINNFTYLLKLIDDISEGTYHYLNMFKKQTLETFKTYLTNNSIEECQKFLAMFGKELITFCPNLMDMMLHQMICLGKDTHKIEQWFTLFEPLFTENYLQIATKELFSHAKSLWEQGELKLSLQIIELVLSKPNLLPILKKDISAFLEKIYFYAKDNRDLISLISIEHLKEMYNLTINPQITSESLANLLADISYLYQQGNYIQTKQYCLWLLHLYPNSDKVLELLARSLFEEKNYSEALKYFSKISNKKIDIEHCIFACKELIKQSYS